MLAAAAAATSYIRLRRLRMTGASSRLLAPAIIGPPNQFTLVSSPTPTVAADDCYEALDLDNAATLLERHGSGARHARLQSLELRSASNCRRPAR